MEHGAAVLLVSLLVAPYTWFVDQCVALPALLHGVVVTRSRMMIAALAFASAVIEVGPLTKHDLLHSKFYLWTTPFYLVWFLVSVRAKSVAKSQENAAAIAVSEPAHTSQEASV